MKFQSTETFQPLKITLETPEEVYRMMVIMQDEMTAAHRLNAPERTRFAQAVEAHARAHYNTQDKKVGV